MSFSLIRLATFSIQFSLAVKSNNTVAAGYLTYIRSLLGHKNNSTMSIMFFRYLWRTAIPSGWHAHNSKILATLLYSGASIGRFIIVLTRGWKMSLLMNHRDIVSYISLSLNSRIMSITIPIKDWIYFLSATNEPKLLEFLKGLIKYDIHSTKYLECTNPTTSGFLKSWDWCDGV